jgi:hypothetical protein
MATYDTKYKEQAILNRIFDDKTNTLKTSLDSADGEITYTYSSGNLVSAQKVVDGKTYTKTYTYDTSDNLISISAWI